MTDDEIENPFEEGTPLYDIFERRVKEGMDFRVTINDEAQPRDRRRAYGEALTEFFREARRRDTRIILAARSPPREWQCTECGYVIEAETRPSVCPHCNFTDGDRIHEHGSRVARLFIPREACGWFK